MRRIPCSLFIGKRNAYSILDGVVLFVQLIKWLHEIQIKIWFVWWSLGEARHDLRDAEREMLWAVWYWMLKDRRYLCSFLSIARLIELKYKKIPFGRKVSPWTEKIQKKSFHEHVSTQRADCNLSDKLVHGIIMRISAANQTSSSWSCFFVGSPCRVINVNLVFTYSDQSRSEKSTSTTVSCTRISTVFNASFLDHLKLWSNQRVANFLTFRASKPFPVIFKTVDKSVNVIQIYSEIQISCMISSCIKRVW